MKLIFPSSANRAKFDQYGRQSLPEGLSSGSRHWPGDMCEPVHEFSKKLRWIRFLGGVIEPMMKYDAQLFSLHGIGGIGGNHEMEKKK
jgi:hypothetical protein